MAKEKNSVPATAPKTGEVLPPVPYRALQMSAEKLTDIMKTNAGIGGIRAFDLDRVTMPAGGGLAWEVPTLKGPVQVNSIEGIIIHWKDTRSYWPDAYSGEHQPPQCSSNDSITGVGDPGGSCATCVFAQWGSANGKTAGKRGRGQACKQARMLFVLRENDLIPILINLPPTSVKACHKYFMRLISGDGIDSYYSYGVITKISLTKTKNTDGIAYSQAEFQMVRSIDQGEMNKVQNIAAAMKAVFDQQTIIDAGVRGSE